MYRQRLLNEFSTALSSSTWKNKYLHVNTYHSFCKEHLVDPLQPSVYDLLSLILYLKDRLRASGSVLSYLSSIKQWVTSVTGDVNAFNAPEISVMKKGVVKNCMHVPSVVPGIPPSLFKSIIHFLHVMTPRPHVMIIALLVGYSTLVRQSNLIVYSNSSTIPHHVLKRGDVQIIDNALLVTIRSTKTRGPHELPVIFCLPAIPLVARLLPGVIICKPFQVSLRMALLSHYQMAIT